MGLATHYENIIGGTAEEKESARKTLQEAFEEKNESLASFEIEKTPEDLEIINRVELAVDEMVAAYGGQPKAIPLDHIHLLKSGAVSRITEGKLKAGIFKQLSLNIGVEKKGSKLALAASLAHELLHLKSYKSVRVRQPDGEARLYRSGLQMFDIKDGSKKPGEEKVYFDSIEEAIVAECAGRVLDKISSDEIFRGEVEAVKKIGDWATVYYRKRGISEERLTELAAELISLENPERRLQDILARPDEDKRQSYTAGLLKGLAETNRVVLRERGNERKKLSQVMESILIGSKGKFKNREAVFTEFAKANFSGNYLPLARIVEDALGVGSFRKLAEEFSSNDSPDK